MAELWHLIGANATISGGHIVFKFRTDSDRPAEFALSIDDTVALGPTGLREVAIARETSGADPWFVPILISEGAGARASPQTGQVLVYHVLEAGGKWGFLYSAAQARGLIEEIAKAAGLRVSIDPPAN